MKRLILGIAVALIGASLSAAQVVEAVIARVGDRIITRSQYADRLRDGFAQIEASLPRDQVAARKAAFRKDLLEEMVDELLIKDRADRMGLTVSSAELNEAIGRLKQQYGLKTDEEFNHSLKQSGLTREEMEVRLRDSLLTNKVFSRELRSREELTDRELRERYEREKQQYKVPARARVREIIIPAPDENARAAARARAEEAAARAKKGEEFPKLVFEYSEAPSKEQGGDIGTISKGELLPVLDSGVFTSDAGAILGPIETRFGWHVLRVEERLPEEIPSFDSIKERLRKEADEETFQRDLRAYLERLRKEAYVKVYEENVPGA